MRTQTIVEIQVASVNALKEWAEQPAILQVLCAEKANWELWGLGFCKLDKANCEVLQQNLTMDFYADCSQAP